jgi:hypothetical protein
MQIHTPYVAFINTGKSVEKQLLPCYKQAHHYITLYSNKHTWTLILHHNHNNLFIP